MGVTLDMFRNKSDGRSYRAGEIIFAAGDAGSEMYVVLEGEVELRIGEMLLETLGPGEPFGEMALVERAPRIASAVAKTDCKVVPIVEERFIFMVQQTPHFALQIMKVMAARLREMDRRAASGNS
jgi:CRP/FNR family transcriptional regulator, cyclic AMP receptor protein